jgi:hypothetical protein
MKHYTESSPAQVIKPTKAQDATGWRQPEMDKPFPRIGARAYFCDQDARYGPRYGMVYGEVVYHECMHVKLRLDDGRTTSALRSHWVGEA